jgi:hypothetical protein
MIRSLISPKARRREKIEIAIFCIDRACIADPGQNAHAAALVSPERSEGLKTAARPGANRTAAASQPANGAARCAAWRCRWQELGPPSGTARSRSNGARTLSPETTKRIGSKPEAPAKSP